MFCINTVDTLPLRALDKYTNIHLKDMKYLNKKYYIKMLWLFTHSHVIPTKHDVVLSVEHKGRNLWKKTNTHKSGPYDLLNIFKVIQK